jgi:hypothetical protein
MPERAPGALVMGQGYVIRTQDDVNNRVYYEWLDGTVQWTGSGWDYSSEDPMPIRWTASLKFGTCLGAVSLDSPYGEASLLTVNTGTKQILKASTDLANPIKAELCLLTIPQVVGASMNPTDQPWDEMRFLVREGASFSEAWAQVDATGIVLPINETFGALKEYPLAFLGTPTHLRYFHDPPPNSRSFAQSHDASSWTTWVWWDTVGGYATLPSVTHRIDAIISRTPGSTLLFSTEDQIGRVYEYNGSTATLVAEFALGSLRFIGEAYLGLTWKMLFSRCLIDTANERIRFEIRAIDTADLVATFGG